jgi:anaerobic magnesium-protoporphyrin IX monomethyl ester cyclase
MKVTLIIPPNPFLADQKRCCPLGILYVASALEERHVDVQIADLRGQDTWVIPEADYYGVTSSTPEFKWAKQVRDQIKGKVVLGGAHACAVDECREAGFDVIVGEGERAIFDWIDTQEPVIYAKRIPDINALPFPARHLLPEDSVVSTTLCNEGKRATTIMSSRGCCFGCNYCSTPKLWGRKITRHSPAYTILEAHEIVSEYWLDELRFQDDELNLDGEWLDRIAPIGKFATFRCHARAECGHWNELRNAGCYEVAIGVETATPEAHKMHKHVDLAVTTQGVRDAYTAGLQVRLFFIVGLPFDNGNAETWIRFFEQMPPLVGVRLNIFTPFPGSQIGDHPEQWGGTRTPTEDLRGTLAEDGKPHFTWKHNGELEEFYGKIEEYLRGKGWMLS